MSEERLTSVEKVTRRVLRLMAHGETICTTCRDALDLDSQKNTAYRMQKIEGCRFRCKADGLVLKVTREDPAGDGDSSEAAD